MAENGAGKQMYSGGGGRGERWRRGGWHTPQAFVMYCIKNHSKVSKVQFLSVQQSTACSLLHVHRVEAGWSGKQVFLSASARGKMYELASPLDRLRDGMLLA